MKHRASRWLVGITGSIAGLAVVAAACGESGGTASQRTSVPPTARDAWLAGVSSSMVAPNTFLTFESKRYRLVNLKQANLVDENQFEKIGAASQADIDQQDLGVYRRQGDTEAIYTYAPAQPAPTEVAAVEGESGGTPALWYRWMPES